MVQKAPGAYQTISEVSAQLGVPTHVLRFWESKFSALKPMKRSGGRRYYCTEDIELLQTIKSLLYDEGYTIKGAQNSLAKRMPKPDTDILVANQSSTGPAYQDLDDAEVLLRKAENRVGRLIDQLKQ